MSNDYTLGGIHTTMTTYRERLKAGEHDAAKQPNPDTQAELNPDELPGRHAPLDELATARGIIWANDNMSVAEKQDAIRSALEQ